MSGANMPIGRALSWCGWQVESFDWVLSAEHDLTQPDLQQQLVDRAPQQAALFIAMECATFSRAREKPLAGGPRPLRSDVEPLGLSTLQVEDRTRVDTANQLAEFTAKLADVAHQAGAAVVLENPRNAYYWVVPRVLALLHSGFADFDYHSCAWGGARAKKQRLRSNCDTLSIVRAECKHIHDAAEWRATRDEQTGRYTYPTAEEQEYTAELAFAIATALSMKAAATG
eukprot:6492567-Amphidinium_carterae.2